jgi:lysine 2,3-aminomutase
MSLAIHVNHVDEFDAYSIKKILELGQTQIQILSQTVLLKGINDQVSDLVNLFVLFQELKIRPYYLHHPDRVKGGMHFYLPLEKGRALYGALRSQLPGWAIPQYVIDLPGGHGKISAFNPETFAFSGTFLGQTGESIPLQELEFFD